jgi:dolichol kinase
VAALVGRRAGAGGYRFASGKSAAGSLSFLAVATVILWAVPGIGPVWAGACAVLLTATEAASRRVNDNLYLPILGAALVAVVLRGGLGGGFS